MQNNCKMIEIGTFLKNRAPPPLCFQKSQIEIGTFLDFFNPPPSWDIVPKRDLCQFPAIFMREKKRPLIGQAVNRIIPALLPWAAWPIRGPSFYLIKMAGN